MPRGRWFLAWFSAAVLIAAEPAPATRPLAMSGAGQEAIDHALIQLARGDTSGIEALELSAFLDPVARPDRMVEGLTRRWTTALPEALARLDPTARTRALTRLDARYRTLSGTGAGERLRLASAFLPAPQAVADLTLARDRAFDLGRFSEFLGLAQLLANGGRDGADADRRSAVAVRLSAAGPQVDDSLRLPPPGTPQPSAGTATPAIDHLAMRWTVVPGWVLACDPFGQVVWQYRVDRLAEVTTGPGAVLVRDSSGVRTLDDLGRLTVLPPLPTGAVVLTIAGGSAWFATGERAWRLVLADGAIQSLPLSAPPLGPPLVRGAQSLWLTAHDLLLFDGDRPVHRLRHRLPATSGWRLGADGARPVVVGQDARLWRLESFDDQLARLDGNARAELLLQARRYQEVLDLLPQPVDAAARRLVLRAHLGLGATHVAALKDAAYAWCNDAQDRALVLLARLAGVGSATLGDDARPDTAALLTALDALAGEEPTVLLTGDTSALADPSDRWDHLCTGAAWLAWRRAAARVPTPRTTGPLVLSEPLADATTMTPAERQADGTLRQGAVTYRLERGIDSLSVTASDADGRQRWHQRWRPASFLSAPSQTLEVRDGLVLVLEGGLRLTVLDAGLGVQRGRFTVDDLGSGTSFFLGDTLAVLGPLGIDHTLTLTDALGSVRTLLLPSPARWAVPIGATLLVLGHDGVARRYPEGTVVTLPADLMRARRAPLATPTGLLHDGRRWPWAP